MLDSPEDVHDKISGAFCEEGNIEHNGVLSFAKMVLFQVYPELIIERPEKWGGNSVYKTYEELEQAFAEKKVHPQGTHTLCLGNQSTRTDTQPPQQQTLKKP